MVAWSKYYRMQWSVIDLGLDVVTKFIEMGLVEPE